MIRCLLLATLSASLAGCLGASQPSHYYVLTPTKPATSLESPPLKAAFNSRRTIGIGPIEVPKYLDRSNLVTLSGTNQLNISEFDTWAEPLNEGLQRVFVQNIGQSLKSNGVLVVPHQSLDAQELQVSVAIDRFECDSMKKCFFQYRWGIRSANTANISQPSMSTREATAPSAVASQQVETLNLLVAEGSREIAETLLRHYSLP